MTPAPSPAETLRSEVEAADAVVIGAGAGLSAAAGLAYSGPRFERLFPDFVERYGLTDMYSSGFYPFRTAEERWAYWSRHVLANRYDAGPLPAYTRLRELVAAKEHFVITTNVDHQFLLAGLDPARVFATQGDYGLFQCSVPCRQETWSNEEEVRAMAEQQRDCRIPSGLVPTCPFCGAPAAMNLRVDGRFVQDAAWDEGAERYGRFVAEHESGRVAYLEIGIGWNTPGIIKYPFWRRVAENPEARYVLVNPDPAVPSELSPRTAVIGVDAATALGV